MLDFQATLAELQAMKTNADIRIQTLGGWQVWREEALIPTKEWGRDKTLQLVQFFVTARHRRGLHKEQIVDRIWEDLDGKAAESTFKVAMHGVNKALEPNRPSRTDAKYILRQGLTYQLNLKLVWVDVQAVEDLIELGNLAYGEAKDIAIEAYREAIHLHHGVYLPNRIYDDWSSEERERIQVLVLGAILTLGELICEANPMETIRLTQQALQIDHAWEDAYRLQMQAYLQKGNRPMAIKTYRQCEKILEAEFGIAPLPETEALYEGIMAK